MRGLPFGAVPSHSAGKHARHRMQCARVSIAVSKGIPNQKSCVRDSLYVLSVAVFATL